MAIAKKPPSDFEGVGRLEKLPLGIGAKITLPYLFLALVIAIAASFIATQIVFDTVEERFINQLVESGKLASEVMVTEEEALLETLRLLANAEGVSGALQQKDADRLRQLSFGIIVNNQREAVEFLDADGQHVLSVHHIQGGNLEEYSFSSQGSERFDWRIVRQVLNQQVDDLGDKYSEHVRAGWGDYFYAAGPVLDESGELVGVVLVGESMDTLVRKLREATLAQVTLYGFDGGATASTFIQPAPISISLVQQVLINQDEASFQRDLSRELTVQNIGYEELLGPWEGRGDEDLGVLGVSMGKSFLVNATRTTRLQASLLVLLTLAVVVLAGITLSSLITRPIHNLVQASQKVAGGDFGVYVEPTTQDELSVLVRSFNQMVEAVKSSESELVRSYDSTLAGWSMALELRDKETKGHTTRVTEITVKIARQMGINEEKIVHIRRGALLHDIGKMGVPDAILQKPAPLSEEDFIIIRKHPTYAYEMLKNIPFLQPALAIPYCHHEHWDGSGYPRGLKGEEIPLEARIFALVDVWDALCSDRPYRGALPQAEVVAIIKSEIGTYFDPQVANEFLRLVTGEA